MSTSRVGGFYRLRIRGTDRRPNYDPDCYVNRWNSGPPDISLCGSASSGKKFTRAEAEQFGQQWADWLIANGFEAEAGRIEIVPANGGMATGWRAKRADKTAV